VEWNPIRFDIQLLRLWIDNRILGKHVDQPWPPHGHDWVMRKPDLNTPVNLGPIAVPQGVIFQPRKQWANQRDRIKWLVCCLSLVTGAAILFRLAAKALSAGHSLRPVFVGVSLGSRVQLNVGLRFRKSVDYIRHEEVTAEKPQAGSEQSTDGNLWHSGSLWRFPGRQEFNTPRISIRGIWVAAFGFPRVEPWSPRFNFTLGSLL
jgi:hypothetical protein